jgi:lipid-A-disaccharide synthase
MTQPDRPLPLSPLRILISTGEVSGDLQGSYLIQALHRQAQKLGMPLQVAALGGQRMVAAGADLVADTTGIGSVGIFEAIPYVLPTLKVQRQARQYLQDTPSDLVIFIDYMNPNLSLGQYLRKQYPDLPTAYYIAPQQWVWAFSKSDTRNLVAIADRMVAVFPEEAKYYRQFDAEVAYFGHPLIDKFPVPPDRTAAREALGLAPEGQVITLLPASRRQEVKYVLPRMLAVAARLQSALPQVQFLMPLSMERLRPLIEPAIARTALNIRLVDGQTPLAIAAADLVLNKSGTVNLEVALMNVPQIVVYCLNPLTARIGHYLLKLPNNFISPVNLFLQRSVVPEFIQWEATVEAMTAASLELLQETPTRQAMLAGYAELREHMGQPGVCDRVAAHLLNFALQRPPFPGQVPTPKA